MRRPIFFYPALLIECTHFSPQGQQTMLDRRTIGLQPFSLSPPVFPRWRVSSWTRACKPRPTTLSNVNQRVESHRSSDPIYSVHQFIEGYPPPHQIPSINWWTL
jgi:hypothetical protein